MTTASNVATTQKRRFRIGSEHPRWHKRPPKVAISCHFLIRDTRNLNLARTSTGHVILTHNMLMLTSCNTRVGLEDVVK